MQSRRQEKFSSIIRQVVSEAVTRHLSDPRIEGFVSITRVEMTPDLKIADVYMSIFGGDEVMQEKTFVAISHARSRIQSLLGSSLQSRYCPVLRFHKDEKFKKTLETLRIIEQAAGEIKDKDADINNKQ